MAWAVAPGSCFWAAQSWELRSTPMGLSPQNVDFNFPDSLLPCALSALGRPILLASFQGVWALREACYEIPRAD